jgi:hypothetical protein
MTQSPCGKIETSFVAHCGASSGCGGAIGATFSPIDTVCTPCITTRSPALQAAGDQDIALAVAGDGDGAQFKRGIGGPNHPYRGMFVLMEQRRGRNADGDVDDLPSLQNDIRSHAQLQQVSRLIDGQLDQIGARLRVGGRRYLAYACIEDAWPGSAGNVTFAVLPDNDAVDAAFRHIEIHLTLARPRKAEHSLSRSQHLAHVRLPAGDRTVVIGDQRGVARLVLRQFELLFRLVARSQRGSIRILRLFQLQSG